MPAKTDRKIPDSNTETKIKAAARSVFHKKDLPAPEQETLQKKQT